MSLPLQRERSKASLSSPTETIKADPEQLTEIVKQWDSMETTKTAEGLVIELPIHTNVHKCIDLKKFLLGHGWTDIGNVATGRDKHGRNKLNRWLGFVAEKGLNTILLPGFVQDSSVLGTALVTRFGYYRAFLNPSPTQT